MPRPFEGIRIIDITHVLAGPFAAYQLGLLGADVIKVEDPNDPDQSRDSGTDNDLNHAGMGTGFLTQGSNKRAITLNLKTEQGRAILKKLAATADVLVENYRPGAFEALGLGYEDLRTINPRLIYASFSAFGQGGPKRERTAYDHVIQSTSGIMAMTGTPEVNPIKIGAPAIDYATGTMGAYALSAALFQRERTGEGQRVDMAMLDVAMILMASHLTGYLRNGKHPKPSGNRMPHATSMAYWTADGIVMLGASNLRQQKRLWTVLERPDLIKRTNDERAR
jgi:crotonobetainyl-CoA:carnitine CoA-transferase CaiB-like acyl-CoA transferase